MWEIGKLMSSWELSPYLKGAYWCSCSCKFLMRKCKFADEGGCQIGLRVCPIWHLSPICNALPKPGQIWPNLPLRQIWPPGFSWRSEPTTVQAPMKTSRRKELGGTNQVSLWPNLLNSNSPIHVTSRSKPCLVSQFCWKLLWSRPVARNLRPSRTLLPNLLLLHESLIYK
jgi:hypothetical protein